MGKNKDDLLAMAKELGETKKGKFDNDFICVSFLNDSVAL